ncbi:MAG: GyrI-like domain-containing protein [Candidatus Margulisiibacteriota bacterium]
MKIIKWGLIVIVALVLIVAAWLAYMGVFSTPKVTVQKVGPYTLVYEEYVGPYSNTGKVIQRVYDGCTLEGVMTEKGFGIYLNDPKMVDQNKMRSEIGCVLEAKDFGKARQLRKKFKIKTWRASDCLVAEFPIRNNLSYMIGPFKAYPELNKAMNAKKAELGACMELYDMPARKTLYIFQLAK